MKNNFLGRPQTSKYRNESHIHFGDGTQDKEPGSECLCAKPKKRPQSYRNLSRIYQCMNDARMSIGDKQTVQYSNVVQNRKQMFQVPKFHLPHKNKQSQDFEAFFEKNGQKMQKPIDQFTEYSDLVQKNSILLRRNQFNGPLKSQTFTDLKRNTNSYKFSSKASRCYSGYRGTLTNLTMANTIGASLNGSIREKKELKKQKNLFETKRKTFTKAVNKTCLEYAKEYKDLVEKDRSSAEKVPLKNAMTRVLTMEEMGKKMSNLTQMYI